MRVFSGRQGPPPGVWESLTVASRLEIAEGQNVAAEAAVRAALERSRLSRCACVCRDGLLDVLTELTNDPQRSRR